MENENTNIRSAYEAFLGTLAGKPVKENNEVADRRAAIWLHENFTEDEIWSIYDTMKWEQEMSEPQEEPEVAPVIDIKTRKPRI